MTEVTKIVVKPVIPVIKITVSSQDAKIIYLKADAPQGPRGASQELTTVIAGENLSSGRVVNILEGTAHYFDPMNESYAGWALALTKTAALQGSSVQIQVSGLFYLSGLGLNDGKYFCGLNGILTQDLTGLKIVQPIGVTVSPDKLAINFSSSIITI